MTMRVEAGSANATVPGWVDWFVPPPLTRRRIVHTALALVDESGLRRLTLDRLAAHLAVTPEALGHHVASRTELIELLVDHVNALVLQAAGPPARTGLAEVRHVLAHHRDVWVRHRPLIAGYALGVLGGPAEDELVERLTAALTEAGLGPFEAGPEARLLLLAALLTRYGADEAAVDRRLAALDVRSAAGPTSQG